MAISKSTTIQNSNFRHTVLFWPFLHEHEGTKKSDPPTGGSLFILLKEFLFTFLPSSLIMDETPRYHHLQF